MRVEVRSSAAWSTRYFSRLGLARRPSWRGSVSPVVSLPSKFPCLLCRERPCSRDEELASGGSRMGSESTSDLWPGVGLFPRRGGFESLASVVPPSGFPRFRRCRESDPFAGRFVLAGSREPWIPGVPVDLGFGSFLQCGRGFPESFALSREADRGVEGVSRAPVVSNFGASPGCGLPLERPRFFLGGRGFFGGRSFLW